MRIAYVSTDPGIPVFGCKGASIHVQEMIRAFLVKGAEVTVISPRLEGDRPADLCSVLQYPLPPAPKGDNAHRTLKQIALNGSVTQALSDAGPFDLIYERHALFSFAAMEFARNRCIPSVLEVNAPLIDEQSRHRSLLRIDDAIVMAHRAVHAARQIVTVSPEVSEYVVGLGAEPGRIKIEPNAVTPARFPEPASFDGPFRVGFLGTLKPWHDVVTVVSAFALLKKSVPDAELLIVGDGPERAALTAQADAAGILKHTYFTGAVPADEVPGWLAKMHVGLATYRGADPFYFSPLKLYEYMAAGLPCVVSRVGTLADAIEENRTGLSVTPDSPECLAEALAQLAAYPDLTRQMGQKARAHVLASRTWDHVASRVLARAGVFSQPVTGAA